MNTNQKSYLDGASMAYRDCADKVEELIKNAPDDLKIFFDAMLPIAVAMRMKAAEIHKEAKRYEGERQ